MIKIVEMLPGTADESNIWTALNSRSGFRLDPLGRMCKKKAGGKKADAVLCQFVVRSVIQEWPTLKVRLSKNTMKVLTALMAILFLAPAVFNHLRPTSHFQSIPIHHAIGPSIQSIPIRIHSNPPVRQS